MKKLILIIIFFLSITTVNAQRPTSATQVKNFSITGNVTDKGTKEPLEYATIVFKKVVKDLVNNIFVKK